MIYRESTIKAMKELREEISEDLNKGYCTHGEMIDLMELEKSLLIVEQNINRIYWTKK